MDGIAGLSLLDCFDEEGEVDMERFSHFQRIQMEEFDDIDELVSDLEEEDEEEGDDKRKRDAKTVASNRSKRSVKKRHTLLYRDTDGSVKPLTWDKSIWYLNYLENPKPGEKRWNEKFRKRFRMQHESFIELHNLQKPPKQFVPFPFSLTLSAAKHSFVGSTLFKSITMKRLEYVKFLFS